jgi:hypothetical protein
VPATSNQIFIRLGIPNVSQTQRALVSEPGFIPPLEASANRIPLALLWQDHTVAFQNVTAEASQKMIGRLCSRQRQRPRFSGSIGMQVFQNIPLSLAQAAELKSASRKTRLESAPLDTSINLPTIPRRRHGRIDTVNSKGHN